MRHYVTHFDSNYLAKGFAMVESLLKHSSVPAQIHVLAMDDATFEFLWSWFATDVRVKVYAMSYFNSQTNIESIRKTRTHQEFCWTVGSVFTDFVMRRNGLDELTYIDADCFFFSDPEPVFTEIGDKSIAITPHRFAKKDEARLLPNGKYAVQWVTFRGEVGRRCLSKWAGQVRDWCKYENDGPGRFADQGYLDFFDRDYPGEVCEVQNIGVGTAPWNVGQYEIGAGPTVNGNPIILYHFHEFAHDAEGNATRLTGWKLPDGAKQFIYGPYMEAVLRSSAQIRGIHADVAG